MATKPKNLDENDNEKVRLRREFGLLEGVAVIVGLVIGKTFCWEKIWHVQIQLYLIHI